MLLLLRYSWEFQNNAFRVGGGQYWTVWHPSRYWPSYDMHSIHVHVGTKPVCCQLISVLWGPALNSCLDVNLCLCIGLNFVGQYLCPLDDERDQGVDKTLNVMCNKIISSLAEKHEFISKKTCWRTICKLVHVHPLITTFLPCSYKSATVYWCVFLDFEWLCNKNFVSMI